MRVIRLILKIILIPVVMIMTVIQWMVIGFVIFMLPVTGEWILTIIIAFKKGMRKLVK